jgi:hypothetical protein
MLCPSYNQPQREFVPETDYLSGELTVMLTTVRGVFCRWSGDIRQIWSVRNER